MNVWGHAQQFEARSAVMNQGRQSFPCSYQKAGSTGQLDPLQITAWTGGVLSGRIWGSRTGGAGR